MDSTRSAPTRTVQPLALAFLIPLPELGGSDGIMDEDVDGLGACGPGEEQRETSGYLPVSEDS